ncbi:thymidylate synthase [Ralstonia pseudosolanacearum]|uniref:thymidylate synthase n=1 Tax=Ralstonia pseudosolanacearum TaxID=1310165 RepID=UPI003CF1B562
MQQHPMAQFHQMLDAILKTGIRRPNRTGIDTYFLPGYMLRFDLANEGFPAITTKKLAFKSMVGELLGFFRGYQWAHEFRSIGSKVWDQNANETASWLASEFRAGHDHIGRVYGSQWTDWRDWRHTQDAEVAQRLKESGYEVIVEVDSEQHNGPAWVLRKGINQLEVALRNILTDPTSRRIIVNGWRPDEHDQGALPACHVAYQFLVDPVNKELHMTLWQRSFDSFLAFNISEGALFLEIMARLTGLKAKTFSHFVSDVHLYVDHVEQVRELLSRDHFDQPTLVISDRVKAVSLEEIPGVFTRIEPDDFELKDYRHHAAIKATMAA